MQKLYNIIDNKIYFIYLFLFQVTNSTNQQITTINNILKIFMI
jgi:hypothetical protein